MKELNQFEKFLVGKKTYLVVIAWAIYGVLVQGYKQHHWTTLGGAWTWLLAGGGVSALRAALAELQVLLTPPISGSQIFVEPPVEPPIEPPVEPLVATG